MFNYLSYSDSSAQQLKRSSKPIFVGQYNVNLYARDVSIDNNYAYVEDYYGKFYIIDISTPSILILAGSLDLFNFIKVVVPVYHYAILANYDSGLSLLMYQTQDNHY